MATRRRAIKKEITTAETEPIHVNAPEPRSRKKLPLIIGLLLIAGSLIYFLSNYLFVASVNGRMISRLAMYQELEKLHGNQVLDSLVTKAVVYQEAEKRGLQISDEELDNEMKEIEERFSSQGQSLDQILVDQGYTREELREQIRLQLLVEKMVADKASVTPEEIDAYLTENAAFLPTGAPEEEQRKDAEENLKQEKIGTSSQELLEELKNQADIKYFSQKAAS